MTRPASAVRHPSKRPVSGNKKRGLEVRVCLRRGAASENPVSTHYGGGRGSGEAAVGGCIVVVVQKRRRVGSEG